MEDWLLRKKKESGRSVEILLGVTQSADEAGPSPVADVDRVGAFGEVKEEESRGLRERPRATWGRCGALAILRKRNWFRVGNMGTHLGSIESVFSLG